MVHADVVHDFQTCSNSYRIEPGSDTAYEWYCVSQMYADAAMAASGDSNYLQSMDKTYAWINHLWDIRNPGGGYFASADIKGCDAGGGKYVDDNSLAGNVYLDCYAVSSGAAKTNYLYSAMAAANWLMSSGEWDNTFGGGFWWDMNRKNKPTQSNGLAMQLFLRLYQITGRVCYRDWAISIKNWLEARMFNSVDGLYVWQITTNGTPEGLKSPVEFTYDNAIMIEADLLYCQVMSANDYEAKAQNLARSLNAKLWNNSFGCYYFNTSDGRVNPCWCGWASQSLIKLFQADGNTSWLKYAQRNIDYMNHYLRNTKVHAYFQFCDMNGSNVTTNRVEEVDQAWMQRVQALLSKYR